MGILRKFDVKLIVLLACVLLTMLISCSGEDVSKRVSELHQEAVRLSEEAVAFQQDGKSGAAQTRYREAVRTFMEILELAPDRSEAWLNLGILYSYFKDYEKAEEALDKSISLNNESGKAHFYRGYVYLEEGDLQEAEIALKMAIDRGKKYAPAYFFYGKVQYELGDYYKAKTALEKYTNLDPEGRYASAAGEFLGVLPEDIITPPQDVDILPTPQTEGTDDSATPEEGGQTETTEPEPAVQPPQETSPEPAQPEPSTPEPEPTTPVDSGDQDTGTESGTAIDGTTTDDTPPASEPEQPAPEPFEPEPVQPVEPEPEPEPLTYTELIEAGRWAMAISDYDTAIGYFREAHKLEPLFNEVNYLLGKTYRADGDLNRAIDHLKVAIDRKPDDANSLVEIAYCYEGKGDNATAIDYFEKSLAIKDREDIRRHVEELRGE